MEFNGENCFRLLTFCHGLEVQFAAVASKAGDGACSHLENVDAARLEASDDRRVGLAPQDSGVILRLVLKGKKECVHLF